MMSTLMFLLPKLVNISVRQNSTLDIFLRKMSRVQFASQLMFTHCDRSISCGLIEGGKNVF